MRWARSRRLIQIVGAVSVVVLVDAFGPAIPFFLPNLLNGGVATQPLANLLSVIVALGVVSLLQRRVGPLEEVAVRRLTPLALDVGLLTGLLAAEGLSDSFRPVGGPASALRVAVGTIGLALLCVSMFRSVSLPAIVITVWYVLNVSLGASRDGSRAAWWAWYAAPAKDSAFFVFPDLLLALGLVAYVVSRLSSSPKL